MSTELFKLLLADSLLTGEKPRQTDTYSSSNFPRITMPACHASAEITRELLEKDRTPHAITYVPEWMSLQYTAQVEHWMNGVGDGDSSTQINVADGKQVDESDFGHAATDGFSYGHWLSFS